MIYGLQSRKELNSSHGSLLCFDNKAQRWGVELLAFGIKTGKQLAIKASNLRRILPDAKPVLPEADDAGVYPHKFADESWSDDSWDERDPKWRAAV